jgi:hypothetical protein
MQIRNNSPLDLTGLHGERITVTAVSALAGDTVAFSETGGTGGPLTGSTSFILDRANIPTVLTLVFNFVGGGGAFEITVVGSAGGPQSFFTFNQFGLAIGSISYNFDVL